MKPTQLPTFGYLGLVEVVRIGKLPDNVEVDVNYSGRESGGAFRYTVHGPTERVHVYIQGESNHIKAKTLTFTTAIDETAARAFGPLLPVIEGVADLVKYLHGTIDGPVTKITITVDDDVVVERWSGTGYQVVLWDEDELSTSKPTVEHFDHSRWAPARGMRPKKRITTTSGPIY